MLGKNEKIIIKAITDCSALHVPYLIGEYYNGWIDKDIFLKGLAREYKNIERITIGFSNETQSFVEIRFKKELQLDIHHNWGDPDDFLYHRIELYLPKDFYAELQKSDMTWRESYFTTYDLPRHVNYKFELPDVFK
ncbi:hypothetical protein SAMN04487866_1282 [Thermoactinomyces sp. DSM 45891]|uniref:hypothetical protein n=1 Tax=Thermoactinomyces sp. DSM 45891 TaxID=1761907 RepID=UPI0009191C1D|nr:hypothetical protein [Thermoactinomyces sp. DSM 45891]SFX80612.1 hypothetical protein SAMN04487866_1282 [Thermoactinomyces sp. DSM 45891]